MMVAVGFNPRFGAARKSLVAERRLKTVPRDCQASLTRRSRSHLAPWVETHGYVTSSLRDEQMPSNVVGE